jgi:hypothetical protein
MIDRTKCLEPSATEGGNLVGRDPRQMGRNGLESAGLEAMTPMEVIRAKCLECCAGSAREVRYCVSASCPSWPYRMGSNPFRPPMSEERKAALRASGLKGLVARAKVHRELPSGEAQAVAARGVAPKGRPLNKGGSMVSREQRGHRGEGNDL